jgi:hypothetical protein
LMSLASEIVTSANIFRKPRAPRGHRRRSGDGWLQETLGFG